MISRKELPISFQLAASWVPGLQRSFKGWVWSEKLDGVRAMWDGRGNLISRTGKIFRLPQALMGILPRGIVLDGELWMDRGMFSDTVSILRTRSEWDSVVQYKVFDIYSKEMKMFSYFDRLNFLRSVLPSGTHCVSIHGSTPLSDNEPIAISGLLDAVIAQGGEGLIIRDPNAVYSPGRKSARLSPILKVKPCLDAEAEVLEVNLRPGRKGSVTVVDSQGKIFKIGSGFRDLIFQNPPSVGDIITYGFTSVHADSGLPRFPRYIRNRSDADL